MANTAITALKLTAQAATVNSGDLDNVSGNAAAIVVDITAITGTAPTAVVLLEGKDPVSGKYYTILQSAALVATGVTILRVFPGATVVANLAANDMVPGTVRVTCTIGGTTPAVTGTVALLSGGR